MKKRKKFPHDELAKIIDGTYEPDSISFVKFKKELNAYAKNLTWEELKWEKSTYAYLVPSLYETIAPSLHIEEDIAKYVSNLLRLFKEVNDKATVLLANALILHNHKNLPVSKGDAKRVFYHLTDLEVIDYTAKAMRRIYTKEKNSKKNIAAM